MTGTGIGEELQRARSAAGTGSPTAPSLSAPAGLSESVSSGSSVDRGRAEPMRASAMKAADVGALSMQPSMPAAPAIAKGCGDEASDVLEEKALAQAPSVEEAPPDGGAKPTAASDSDELPYSASARLGVLRKLFYGPGFTLGQPQEAFRVEREAGHSAHARGAFTHVEVNDHQAAAPVNRVVAPEILRPKVTGPIPDKDKEPPLRTVPTAPRHDTADELETLPAWRGQYRRKRIPSS